MMIKFWINTTCQVVVLKGDEGRWGRGRGRGRGRRGSFQNNANVYNFQDPSRVSNVVGQHPGSLTIPLLLGQSYST